MNPIENHVPENVICCLCAISVKADQLESHLAIIHFNSDPYQCESCLYEHLPSKFPTETAIKQHMKEKHQAGKFWYRTWSSADIDQDKANINACLLQSIQNTAKCMGNVAKSSSEEIGNSSRAQDSANMTSYQIAPENHLPQTSSNSRSARKNISSKLVSASGIPTDTDSEVTSNTSMSSSSSSSAVEIGTNNLSANLNSSAVDVEIIQIDDDEEQNHVKIESAQNTEWESGFNWLPAGDRKDSGFNREVPDSTESRAPHHLPAQIPTTSRQREPSTQRMSQNLAQPSFTQIPTVDRLSGGIQPLQEFTSTMLQNQTTKNNDALRSQPNKVQQSITLVRCVECKTLMKNDPNKKLIHINTMHLRIPLYNCTICNHKFFGERDEAVTHQKTYHRAAESVIENLTRLNYPILLKRLNQYFPQCERRQEAESTAKRASSNKRPVPIKKKRGVDYVPQEVVQCRACRQWFVKKEECLLQHIGRMHLQYPLHKCTLCDHTTYDTFTRAMNHAMSCHKGGKEIIDSSERAKSRAQLKLRLLDFFPNLKRMEEMRRRQIMSKVKLEAGSSIKHFPNEILRRRRNLAKKRKPLANKLCCGECDEMIGVQSKLFLFSHVNVKHLRLPVYQCAACPMTFCDYMGSLVSRHVRDQHNGDKSLIRDCREQYREQIQAITKELFGATVL